MKILYWFCLSFALCILNGCGGKKAEVQKANIGDAELAYYIRGSGDPLLMIMGFRGTMAVWDPAFLASLEKNYTLILFDNRGVGFSSNDSNDILTIPKMAEDTAKLIKELGYDEVNVLGWSMGSRIAMDLALKHPEMVSNLILCSPNAGGKHRALRQSNAYTVLTSKDISQKEALSLIFPDTTKGNLASATFVIRLTEGMLQGTIPDDRQVSQQIIDQQIHALQLWDKDDEIYENLAMIKMPTLVAGGREDSLSLPENVKIVASRIPFAWAAYFNGSGHAFISQDHQEFADLVNIFIESNKD
jgi:pimeloyl-ACP methyl ester carboxylesterase